MVHGLEMSGAILHLTDMRDLYGWRNVPTTEGLCYLYRLLPRPMHLLILCGIERTPFYS